MKKKYSKRRTKAIARGILRQMKERNGTIVHHGVATLPGFFESLDLLLNKEKYSLTDVGLMFGVSRERIRQLAASRGWIIGHDKRGSFSLRVWDDELNQFIPRPKGEVLDERRKAWSDEYQTNKQIARIEKRKEIIAKLRALKARLGRDPSIREMAAEVVGRPMNRYEGGPLLANAWGQDKDMRQLSHAERFDLICNLAGISKRGRGSPGHIDLRKTRQTQLATFRAKRARRNPPQHGDVEVRGSR